MATKYATDAQVIENYRVALENVTNQTEIATTMAEFGYDAAKIAEGKQLLDRTRSAFDLNNLEDNETLEAKIDFESKKSVIEQQYSMDRKKAKVIFRNDELALAKLALTGTLPRAYVKWTETMKTFYNGLKADTTLLTRLAPLKITVETVDSAIVTIGEMETARTLYLKEIGESQDATKNKDMAFIQMDDWMRDFYAVAKIAMEDNPQLLEALGLLIRS